MVLSDIFHIWFIVRWGLSSVGFLASVMRFFHSGRAKIERKRGLLPTPIMLFNLLILFMLLTKIGEIPVEASIGWLSLRLAGLGFSVYGLVMLSPTMETIDRFGFPASQSFEITNWSPPGHFVWFVTPAIRLTSRFGWELYWAS